MTDAIDLNADLGEGFGAWRMGDDAGLLTIVTSANVACGFHAGDPSHMARTFAAAKQAGVRVGTHVGYPDLQGFGRRAMALTPQEIEDATLYQIGAAQALAARAGVRIAYVKAHGALANRAEIDADAADALARAAQAAGDLPLLAIALSEQVAAGRRLGLHVFHEIFADRAYTDEGRLAPRSSPGAVITDAKEAAARTRAMLVEGALITTSGQRLPTPIDSICVHGDSPHALVMARALRGALEVAGLRIAAFVGP